MLSVGWYGRAVRIDFIHGAHLPLDDDLITSFFCRAVKKNGTAQVYVVQQSGLMGFFPVNALICGAERTDTVFDVLDKPVRNPALLFTRAHAYRAFNTALRHLFVFFSYDEPVKSQNLPNASL